MAMRRFVEALRKPPRIAHRGKDRIPGTNKYYTYAANASVYSKESNLQKLIRNRCCSPGQLPDKK